MFGGFVSASSIVVCGAGHTHQELKLDCAFTPTDAHVVSGSEDGMQSYLITTEPFYADMNALALLLHAHLLLHSYSVMQKPCMCRC